MRFIEKYHKYDPHLVYLGKDHTSFELPTSHLHIHKHITPKAIIYSIKKEDLQIDLFAKEKHGSK